VARDSFQLEAEVLIEGDLVRLEPLGLEHVDDLAEVGLDPSIWALTPSPVTTRVEMEEYVKEAVDEADSGRSIPFAIVLKSDGRAIGSSRFGNLDPINRRMEIGWTWIGRDWWGSGVNTECKLLLLSHAFERIGCVRVELKTDALNLRSRNAILRIGATEEGTLRKHMVTSEGRWRDTVYYSILDDEWPDTKARLLAMMNRGR
jgi:RimJ/RimL family protein N-acetyltransferase